MQGTRSSCFSASSEESLADVIAALGLKRKGDELFCGNLHVANIHLKRYIFFLRKAGCYGRLVAKAKAHAQLTVFK